MRGFTFRVLVVDPDDTIAEWERELLFSRWSFHIGRLHIGMGC